MLRQISPAQATSRPIAEAHTIAEIVTHLAAWHEWLGALATDAEAAIAAAHVYGELGPEARDAWLDALHEDVPKLLDLWKQGRLKLEELTSQEITVADVNEAFGAMERGEVARSVIRY